MSEVGVRHGDPSSLPELATRRELSLATGVSIPTLCRWAAATVGPKPVRLGGSIRYRKADVLAWLDSLEEAS